MKTLFLSALASGIIITACNSQPPKAKTPAMNNNGTTNAQPARQPVYDIHGVVDPGVGNMVAFALKTPYKWSFQQSFTRTWNGATPINQIHLLMVAPDGSSSVEYLPTTPYYYADGPTARSLRQTATQMGMPAQHDANEMAPMQPADYIRYVILPRLQQYGFSLQVSSQQVLPYVQKSSNVTEARAYVDGSANGKNVRIECVITLTTTNMNGEIYYNWSAMPAVMQCTGDIAACYTVYKETQNSVMFNPAWQQENSRLVNRGNAVNSYYDQKDFNAVKDFRNYQNNLHQQTKQDRDESIRRQAEANGDVLAGKQKYEDPVTGKRITLDANYNYAYRDKSNTQVLYSNTPIDASQVDWIQLQKVETTKY
jgi:hypothetical protein